MAILNPFMSKIVEGNTDLELEAEAGKSLLVTGVEIDTPANNYVELLIERVTVGYFRVGGTLGNHLYPYIQDFQTPNLLAVLRGMELFKGYPIAEGEKFSISGASQSSALQIVSYIEAEAGDFKNTDANGSLANEYLYMSYGRYSGTLADGENVYETPQTPVTFPNFPFGNVVPANHVIHLLGIAASDVGKSTGTNSNIQGTTRLKLTKDRTVLFDPDRTGLYMTAALPGSDSTVVGTNLSQLGNNSDTDQRPVMLFAQPRTFGAGEELIVSVATNVSAGSANLAAADAEVGMIQRAVRK